MKLSDKALIGIVMSITIILLILTGVHSIRLATEPFPIYQIIVVYM